MRIPSLKLLFSNAKITLLRFLFVILSSVVGAVVMIYIIGLPFDATFENQPLYNIVITCTVGISFLLSLAFICERAGISKLFSLLIQIIGIILLFIYYLTLKPETNYIDIARFLSFIIASHLLVSFSPVINKKLSAEINGFWQFNQLLFIRILITAVYSGALYTGLSIAILSFDKLFDMNFDSKIYLKLFFVILGFFNTWFFLSGIPENPDELEAQNLYPKGLKIFTQYVLMPLVIIYLLILYLYTGKILIQWQLPMGWVSYLVLGFSATGIFSILLIHPLRNLEGNNWIKTFSKVFYMVLFPLIILLFVAILRRTEDYGITERRYYVFVLACWLTGIALYFTFSKIKNIKIIPISLFIIAFLTSFGPWSAFSVAQKNQINRLKEILERNEILVNGKIIKASKPIIDEDRKNVTSIVSFLYERRSLDELKPWFNENIDTIISKKEIGSLRNKDAQIVGLMGIEYYPLWTVQNDRNFNYTLTEFKYLDLRGYDYFIRFRYTSGEPDIAPKEYQLDSNKIEIVYLKDSTTLQLKKNGMDILNYNFSDIIEKLKKSKSVNPELKDMSFDLENKSVKAKFVILTLFGEKSDKGLKINNINSDILLKFR